MLIAKPRWNKSTNSNRKRSVILLAWLVFGWVHPAFSADGAPGDAAPVQRRASWRLAPISTNWGGSIGYDILQRSQGNSNPVTQQRVALNLKGKGITYISKPWIALVKGNVDFTSYKMKVEDTSSSYNNLFGDIGLFLLPYSRFAFDAVLSKTQNLTGPGLGSLASQTTRLDMSQRYMPRDKKERYFLKAYRSDTESPGNNNFKSNGFAFSFDTSRLKNQSLGIYGSSDYSKHLLDDKASKYKIATINHQFVPDKIIMLTSYGTLTSKYEELQQGSDSFRIRELNSTLSYRPPASYYLIGGARLNYYDAGGGQKRTTNANLGLGYRPSQHINISASANANQVQTDTSTNWTLTTRQTVNANYPLASFSLEEFRYTSRIAGSITNSTRNHRSSTGEAQSSSQQSVSITPSHGLGRDFLLNGGRLNLGINQSLSLTESTRQQATGFLTHSASATWRRSRGTSITSLALSGRDNRSLNSAQDSFQFISFSGSISEEISRDSRLAGAFAVQSTRQFNNISPRPLNSTTSNANLNYSHMRAFGVRRLTFMSNLQAYSRAPIPVLQAPPDDQGPISWENILSYTVGRLTADFKLNLTKEGNGETSSFVWFSVKRFF